MKCSRENNSAGAAITLQRALYLVLMVGIGCAAAHAQDSRISQPSTGGQQTVTTQPANIGFIDASAVTLSPNSAGTFKLDTAVKNSGGGEGTPSFRLRGVDDVQCDKDPLEPSSALDSIAANVTKIAHFSITGVEMPATCYIELVTKEGGKITNTSLKQIKLSQNYATMDVIGALVVCLVISIAVGMGATRVAVRKKLGRLPEDFEVGPPAWEFAKSWSSTLTLAGATVTAALALSAVPELTRNASKSGYSLLALLIALMVVVAPLSFVIFRRGNVVQDEETKKEDVLYSGGMPLFLLSCTLALFAGLAQLLVLFLLGDELFRDYTVWAAYPIYRQPWWLGLGAFLTLAGAAVLCIHTVRSVVLTVELELANRAKGRLEMVKNKAQERVADLKERAASIRGKVRHDTDIEKAAMAAVDDEVRQASELFGWASEADRDFWIRNENSLGQFNQAELEAAEKGLRINLKSGRRKPPRSWPIL